MKIVNYCWLLVTLSCVFSVNSEETPSAKKPNIVIILADDLGYSDIGSYGGEADTPNLDALAKTGLRFSNYHTSASCAPTRAMLLSGVDSHRAGVANIAEALTDSQAGSPFYRGTLNKNVKTIATLLKDQGYHTYMAGKWHLGHKDPSLRPINRGFDKTVMMPFSGADNWQQRSYLPNYDKVPWYENGKEITLPKDFYSSKYIVDKSIEFIDKNKNDNQPFFSYVSFQAVHIPVQAPKEFTQKYMETYRQGWSHLRRQRQAAVKKLGLVPPDSRMTDLKTTLNWEALSPLEKQYHSKSMAVYAGMIDAMDHHIGRLVSYLKEIGEYDNTIFVFTSDNGAEASDPIAVSKIIPIWMKKVGYRQDIEDLGERESYNYIGPSFASAAVGPLGHYKFYSGEGGLRVPLIISGPVVVPKLAGKISHAFGYVKDLAPTLLDIIGVPMLGDSYQGESVEPMTGKILTPLLTGQQQSIYNDVDITAYEIGGNKALFKGDYKILFNRPPLGDGQWQLYNTVIDPGEANLLNKSHPKILNQLIKDYVQYEKDNGVLPIPDDYDQRKQVIKNAMKNRRKSQL
jgi:arylsulfatase A-like enzyme